MHAEDNMEAPPPVAPKRSYSETSKAIRMARVLLDEGYEQSHVINALKEKGFSMTEALDIIREGRLEYYRTKVRQSRTVALVLGGGFAIIAAIVFFTLDNPASTSPYASQQRIPMPYVKYPAFAFLAGLSSWLYYAYRLRQFKKQQ
jgi:hypothetical protein